MFAYPMHGPRHVNSLIKTQLLQSGKALEDTFQKVRVKAYEYSMMQIIDLKSEFYKGDLMARERAEYL
jgi:hypothetical protein